MYPTRERINPIKREWLPIYPHPPKQYDSPDTSLLLPPFIGRQIAMWITMFWLHRVNITGLPIWLRDFGALASKEIFREVVGFVSWSEIRKSV